MSKFHLIIAVPSKEYWTKPFGLSLCSMVGALCTMRVPGYDSWDFSIHCKDDSVLPRSRQECLEGAIEREATHVLFIDTDQSFPPDTAHRLAAWHKPVVACNVAVKRLPSGPTARARAIHSHAGKPQYVVPGESGLVKTWRIGTGVMLIDLEVVKPLPKPWFNISWRDEAQTFEGEDWWFCKRLEDAGIDIFWDNEVSEEIGHWGSFEFRHAHVAVPKGYEWEGELYNLRTDKSYNQEGGKIALSISKAGSGDGGSGKRPFDARDSEECWKRVPRGGPGEASAHEEGSASGNV